MEEGRTARAKSGKGPHLRINTFDWIMETERKRKGKMGITVSIEVGVMGDDISVICFEKISVVRLKWRWRDVWEDNRVCLLCWNWSHTKLQRI